MYEKLNMPVDSDIITAIRKLSFGKEELIFFDPIVIKKSPHSWPMKITYIAIGNGLVSSNINIHFEYEGVIKINSDTLRDIENSIRQRLLLLYNQTMK